MAAEMNKLFFHSPLAPIFIQIIRYNVKILNPQPFRKNRDILIEALFTLFRKNLGHNFNAEALRTAENAEVDYFSALSEGS